MSELEQSESRTTQAKEAKKMYARFELIGYLGSDPELRYTPTGTAVCSFNFATSDSWTNEQGERQDETTWYRITLWRKQAEIAAQHLAKGSFVMLAGNKMKANAFTDKEGAMRASLEFTANEMKFMPKAKSGEGPASKAPVAQQQVTGNAPIADEEIPF
jgi:single-strand DNA-binding protein